MVESTMLLVFSLGKLALVLMLAVIVLFYFVCFLIGELLTFLVRTIFHKFRRSHYYSIEELIVLQPTKNSIRKMTQRT